MAEFVDDEVTSDVSELSAELLECARYGECEDMVALLDAGAEIAHADGGGNTALHKACANGHVDCVRALIERGAPHPPNDSGNTPLHWAVQNKQTDAVRALVTGTSASAGTGSRDELDVLRKNGFGRSALTDGFTTRDTEIVRLMLEHPSANEEALLGGLTQAPAEGAADGDESKSATADGSDEKDENESPVSVTHDLALLPALAPASASEGDVDCEGSSATRAQVAHADVVRIRELAIDNPDDPFGDDPYADTTGLGIWCASIVLARWIAELGPSRFGGRVVSELGAGCGVAGLTCALACSPTRVSMGELNERTLANLRHNMALNGFESASEGADDETDEPTSPARLHVTKVTGMAMDWSDPRSLPSPVDIIIGADLVYQSAASSLLARTVANMLPPGGEFFYVAPNSGRDGLSTFAAALKAEGVELVSKSAAPQRFVTNPLASGDDDASFLHFMELGTVCFELHEFQKTG